MINTQTNQGAYTMYQKQRYIYSFAFIFVFLVFEHFYKILLLQPCRAASIGPCDAIGVTQLIG